MAHQERFLSDPALGYNKICSFLGVLMRKIIFLSVSVQGFCTVIAQPLARPLEPGNLMRVVLGWARWPGKAAHMSSGPCVHTGWCAKGGCGGLNSAHPGSVSSLCSAGSCPRLAQWPHYPRVAGRVSTGSCLCHSLLPLSPLCSKYHVVEALKLLKRTRALVSTCSHCNTSLSNGPCPLGSVTVFSNLKISFKI